MYVILFFSITTMYYALLCGECENMTLHETMVIEVPMQFTNKERFNACEQSHFNECKSLFEIALDNGWTLVDELICCQYNISPFE